MMFAQRLGLPHIRGAEGFVVATLIDTLGSGLFLPVSLLYFSRVMGVSLPLAGLALSVATVAALPMVPVSGTLIDRFGAKQISIFSQLLQGLGFFGYLFVHSTPALIGMAFLNAAGWQCFWPAHFSLVAQIAAPSERDRWYGLAAMTRNNGLALGGLLAGVLVGTNETSGYHFVVVANGVSFFLAAALLTFGLRARNSADTRKEVQGQSYRLVIQDHPFLLLSGANAIFALCSLLLGIGVPVYVADALHAPFWVVGVMIALSTLLIAMLQTVVVRVLEPYRRTRALMFTGLLWSTWCGLLALAFILPHGLLVPFLIGATGFYALAELIHDPTSNALAAEAGPESLRGRYRAVFQLSWSIASILAPGLFTQLFAVHPTLPWLIMIGLMMCASATLLWVEPHLPQLAVRLPKSSQADVRNTSPDI